MLKSLGIQGESKEEVKKTEPMSATLIKGKQEIKLSK